ncbi:phage tail protein [Bradyrhizobium aeschynomenes]|uniref:phage tail protein n=1 Tax=Bradyrhizobium aeschynomenes TaxID=2734909 RepID=UPI0015563744|nr:tail fiber protein [Bradyrhizobium aeschynomenes]NPV22864.1 tail fiber protein [Bradyrhizobium aeschynomenes]
MTLYRWSQTASADATADPTINWSEGQVPSSINDSARAMMAATAKFRDDIAGALATTGTSTAYALTSNQQFDTLPHLNGQIIAFTPHVTNGAAVTLNVDSLGAKPLRSAPNSDLLPGTIIQGTPYVAVYNHADGSFYLHGFYGNPYNIPLGATLEYWGGSAPNSSFAFPYGQAISRTTYIALFALIGINYGSGDGSTTFNLPDLRGRGTACLDNMGGSSANRLVSGGLASVRHTLGGAGGEDVHTLTLSELPTGIASTGSNNITVQSQNGLTGIPVTTAAVNVQGGVAAFGSGGPYSANTSSASWAGVNSLSGANAINVVSSNTGGAFHNVVQPTILCNRIMRII